MYDVLLFYLFYMKYLCVHGKKNYLLINYYILALSVFILGYLKLIFYFFIVRTQAPLKKITQAIIN